MEKGDRRSQETEQDSDFTPLLKDLNIKHVLTTIENPQANDPVKRVHQLILNIIVTKNLANKVFNYIDTWGETIASIAWAMRAFYCRTIQATSGQSFFGRDMIFNLVLVVDWRVITPGKQRHVKIDNVQNNSRLVTHDYAIRDLLYAEMTGIYRKLEYKKQGLYTITEVFTNGTVKFQWVQVNE